jgi:hypothetical protein
MEHEAKEALQRNYFKLLTRREEMVNALRNLQGAEWQRELMVDALITGVMNHLHEAAAHPAEYAERFKGNGETPGGYAEFVTDNLIGRMTNLG